MTAKEIAERYHMRVLSWLSTLRRQLLAAGFLPGVGEEMHDTQFRWGLRVNLEAELGKGRDVTIDWRIILGKEDTINFGVKVTEEDGQDLGGIEIQDKGVEKFVPMDDPTAVAQRFASFEDADQKTIVDLLKFHLTFEERLKKGGRGADGKEK